MNTIRVHTRTITCRYIVLNHEVYHLVTKRGLLRGVEKYLEFMTVITVLKYIYTKKLLTLINTSIKHKQHSICL